MDLKRLEEIVATPALANNSDLIELIELSKMYPYAQYLKILISKVAQVVHDLEQINKLNTAAVFSADRNILKKVITDPDYTIYLPLQILEVHNNALRPRDPGTLPPNSGTKEGKKETVKTSNETPEPVKPLSSSKKEAGSSIFSEVMRNLEKLRTLRKKYTFLENKEEEEHRRTEQLIQQTAAQLKRDTEMEESAGPMPTLEDLDSDSFIKEPQPEKTKAPETEQADVQARESQTKDKKEQNTELAYQKQLIEEFIKRKISMPSRADEESAADNIQEDLSVQNMEYESGIVSETLANIYKKQGKTEKAVEIYKKLIWKYPQKKAYFAARIEDLKG